MLAQKEIVTADQLLGMGDLGRCELVEGELIKMSPSGFQHGTVTMELAFLLSQHVRQHKLGLVAAAETGFRLARAPDTVRAPDVAFISAQRVPAQPPRGFFEGAPDLAVEVISPEDRWSEVAAKARAWLEAGCRLVWLIDPSTRTATVDDGIKTTRLTQPSDLLDAGDIVPGFSVSLRDLFASLPKP